MLGLSNGASKEDDEKKMKGPRNIGRRAGRLLSIPFSLRVREQQTMCKLEMTMTGPDT